MVGPVHASDLRGLYGVQSVVLRLHPIGALPRSAMRNMKKLVRLALVAVFVSGIASAQNLPPIDVFGGYSYLGYDVPLSTVTPSVDLKMNGWDASASVNLFRHFGAEADFSGHFVSDCGGVANVSCTNFSYMFGPRYTIGDRSSKITGFVHGLIGQDRVTVLQLCGTSVCNTTVNDTSAAFAIGGGADFWIYRHIGLQLGPIDLIHTSHFTNSTDNGDSQNTLRASVGVAFRFGGDFPQAEPKPPKEKKPPSESHRSWTRPWHKTQTTPTEGEPTEGQPTPAGKPGAPAPSHGLAVNRLGVTVVPQEFDGAKIVQIQPGSVAEMASLHVGDMITSVDGKAVRTPMELAAELLDKTGKVRIGILRGKFSTETVIILSAQPQ